jgi:hypothetical protein
MTAFNATVYQVYQPSAVSYQSSAVFWTGLFWRLKAES